MSLTQVKKAVAAGAPAVAELIQTARQREVPAPSGGGTTGGPSAEVAEPGARHLIRHLAQATGLAATLQRVFAEPTALQLVLLAADQLTQATPLYLARVWMEKVLGTAVFTRQGFAGDGGLLEKLGGDTPLRMKFLREWAAQREHPRALVYDLPSISTDSRLLDLAEYGYNRDAEPLRQVNLAAIHDRRDGLPLFYRVLPGSISDVSTLKLTGELIQECGFTDFHFVIDRGFFSQANLAEMIAQKIGFTMAIPFSSTQAKVFIRQRRAAIGKVKNAFVWHGRPLYHLPVLGRSNAPPANRRPVRPICILTRTARPRRKGGSWADSYASKTGRPPSPSLGDGKPTNGLMTMPKGWYPTLPCAKAPTPNG